jgi:hypothetical protein
MSHTEPAAVELQRDPLPLRGRVAVVTGVSRRKGIGYGIARRLAASGASLFLHHYASHDGEQSWGADPGGPQAVVIEVAKTLDDDATVYHLGLDLAIPDAPARLITAATEVYGHLDILVCNHARSGGDGPLGTLDAALLDAHWAVNTRSVLLLAQAFAAQHDGRPGGRVIFMTSGQDLGPMRDEVAYATAKGGLPRSLLLWPTTSPTRQSPSTRSTPAPSTPVTRRPNFTRQYAAASQLNAGAHSTTRPASSHGSPPTKPHGLPDRSSTPKAASADGTDHFHLVQLRGIRTVPIPDVTWIP